MNSRMLGLSEHQETVSKVVEGLSPLAIRPTKQRSNGTKAQNNESSTLSRIF